MKLELDTERFDDASFERYLHQAQSSGIRFTTVAALGDAPQHHQALFTLNKACSALHERGDWCPC